MLRASLLRLADWLCGFLVLAGCAAAFVPFAPEFPVIRIRSALALALNTAVARGLVFGRDIDFSHGPFVAVYTRQYHPATDTLMLAGGALIAASVAAGLIGLSRDRFHPTALALVAFLPLVALNRDALFFAPPLIFLLLLRRLTLPRGNPDHLPESVATFGALALLTAALALLPLIKVTFGAASVVALGLGWLALVARRRWRVALAGAALAAVAMPVFWSLAGQPAAELPAFLLGRRLIVSAYNDGVALDGPAWQPILVVIAGAALFLAHLRAWRAGGMTDAMCGIAVLALLFLGFKAGFVRADVFHLFTAPAVLLIGAWVLAIGCSGTGPMLGLLAALVAWAAIDHAYTGLDVATAGGRIVGEMRASARGFVARVSGTAGLAAKFAESLRAIRAQQALPPISGSADVYSNGQDVLLAHGLDWAPRPVVQSYATYAPGLLRENARHLTGDDAPEHILFQIEPIDGRLPSLEDALSWPILLTRYEPVGLYGAMAVLDLRPGVAAESSPGARPLAAGIFRVGDDIPIPPGPRAVWAEIAMAPTLAGKFLSIAWKLPLLSIRFAFPDGHVERFRYVAGMGITGFLAAPVVRDTAGFIALEIPEAAIDAASQRPRTLTIEADGGPAWGWDETVSVRFFALAIPTRPGLERLLTGSPSPSVSPDAAPEPR